MNKTIAFILTFFLWASSLFPDFDFPFPVRNTRKNSTETTSPKSRSMKVEYSEIRKEDESDKPTIKIKTEIPGLKTQIFKPKESMGVKTEVVTTQGQESPLRNSEPQTISNVKVPEFSRGIYISQRTLKKTKEFYDLRKKGKQHGINFLVIDIQPSTPSKETVETLVAEGFYPVARVVNFDGGLPTEKPSNQRIASILKSIQSACKSGFPEIQLDYIRYADNLRLKLTYETRYKNISAIIKDIRKETLKCENLPYLGADIFGRIPFNENDMIGQKVEVFAQVVDVLYPMLYPSHFYGMSARIKNPYQTVYDGTTLTIKRSLKTTRVVPYIQGFNMSVGQSGLSLSDYIKAQIKASYDSGGNGFVVWNAWNDYKSTFQALEDYDREKGRL
ncbi:MULTISPECIES: putative glycoside hydrolase [Leptospira]|uniref:Glycosyl hydrolase n=3 Tax=Leptospira santarosai TaxID=28183 RepID=A0AB73LX53_9LEPT|nr:MULTISPECIES: putative glycoside hydrolase [Leptospira]EMO57197.1 glycosyl hydrolase domain protein [Leptospira santarosai str. CBC1416]AVV49825.1 Glycosyl hydrolase domain protein [Leptospira santarosai]EKO80248.1 glycosyl hydrolase domain protein [Leptospira sp. Fiocruz LV3954]EMI67780.1 glycosyl hydrolase domain protein [Leptospira sp. Fiocruz LV4135]EMO45358.1 glycosyl hydrolase domain protein [Leptospira santarosai str. ZUN179]